MGWRQRSRAEWHKLVEGWPRSGLTQDEYCAQHGISVASLQRWRSLFAQEATLNADARAPVPPFVPVTLIGDVPVPTNTRADLTLVLTDGLRVEVGAQCSAEMLKRVLSVLQERT